MKIYPINTGFFKLDGGAMFGVVPKSIWNRHQPADANNMCNWAMRCLLIEDGDRLILVDNGIGEKQSEKFFGFYFLNGDDSLSKSLKKEGFSEEDITDVFLTHLHFDHCGGSIKWNQDRTKFEMTFPNARYWICEQHLNWALEPNAREKASFLKENIVPIQESGHLNLFQEGTKSIFPNIELEYVYGHTEAMALLKIHSQKQNFIYMADLIPSHTHLKLPYVMGYDVRPLKTLEEKARILNMAYEEDYVCIFEHDPKIEACSLIKTEKGITMGEALLIKDL